MGPSFLLRVSGLGLEAPQVGFLPSPSLDLSRFFRGFLHLIRFTMTLYAAPVCFWISRPTSVSASFAGGWVPDSRFRSTSTASRICLRPFSE